MADIAIYSLRWSGTRRANLKKSLFIALALLVLPFSLVISSGTANAAVETEKSLNGRLLTTPELKAALSANSISLNIADSADIKDSDINLPDIVGSGRLWLTGDGSLLGDALLSYKDGHGLSKAERDSIINGDMAKAFLADEFKKVEYVGQLQVVSDNDILHGFNGTTDDGTVVQVAIVSFIRGNIFGMVFYGTADNQLGEVLSAFGGQTAKLPN